MGEAPSPSHGTSSSENRTLTGHTLLILSPHPQDASFRARLRDRFPDLKVQHVDWDVWRRGPELPDPAAVTDTDGGRIVWDDVTVFVTGPAFPEVSQAPKLQLVQLQSAGANYVLDKPIFKDTDVAFCTANGVHG